MTFRAAISLLFACVSATMGLAMDIPKTWTSFQWAGDVEAQVADVAAHGVEVIEAPPWNVEVCSNALRICRKYGVQHDLHVLHGTLQRRCDRGRRQRQFGSRELYF